MLAEHGQLASASKPILEINPTHALVATLAGRVADFDKEALADIIWLIFDEARLMDGDKPAELAAELLTTVGAVYRLHYRANQLLRDCMRKEVS